MVLVKLFCRAAMEMQTQRADLWMRAAGDLWTRAAGRKERVRQMERAAWKHTQYDM